MKQTRRDLLLILLINSWIKIGTPYLTQHFQELMRYLTMTKYQSIFRFKEPTSDYFRGLLQKIVP